MAMHHLRSASDTILNGDVNGKGKSMPLANLPLLARLIKKVAAAIALYLRLKQRSGYCRHA